MRKLSKKEWVATIIGVALVAFIFFGNFIIDFFRTSFVKEGISPNQNNISNNVNGVIIHEILSGEGEEAVFGDFLTMHYTLYLSDGSPIVNTRELNMPFSFVLGSNEAIVGLSEGVSGMRAGGIRTIIIPPELAYGERQNGPIPPNSTLVLAVELLSIEKLQPTIE